MVFSPTEMKAIVFKPGDNEEALFCINNIIMKTTLDSPVCAEAEMVLEKISKRTLAFDGVERKKNSMLAKQILLNPPATIIYWEDGSKTVVKCNERDEYNPITGVALCYMKKSLGNTSRGLNDALNKALN